MKYAILAAALCLLVTSCAELQVKRDLTHAQYAQDYNAAHDLNDGEVVQSPLGSNFVPDEVAAL